MDEHVDRGQSSAEVSLRFTRILLLNVDGNWISVESVAGAQCCLHDHFDDPSAPSYVRATDMCATALLGKIPPDAAQAALLVAAMEAGFAFELLEGDALALERKVEAEAEKGLRQFLFAEMAA